MKLKFTIFIFTYIVLNIYLIVGINGQDKTHYIGAVVDFASKINKSLIPIKEIIENLNEYDKYIREASENKADIIVFPECGLTSIHLPTTQADLLPYSSVIPDPTKGTYNPCFDNEPQQSQQWSIHIRRLSCAAQKYNIYVVVNLPERWVNNSSREDDTDLIYNSNIVFDRQGNLIARYRKFNLFVEPGFSKTSTPELIKFKTDFGVTFGTFICFDILFTAPALELLAKNEDVTDIVYPTAWFSELPFLTAVQTQAGWAKANGVNLLTAGYNNPEGRSGGSGIFTVHDIKYKMPSVHESSLILHQVPIIKKRQISVVSQYKPIPIDPMLVGMATQQEDLYNHNYTTSLVNESLSDYRLCHDEFCCVFDLTFNKLDAVDYYYRMIVYHGVRVFGVLHHDIQICGVAACTDKTIQSCGKRLSNITNPSIVFDVISIKGDHFINKNASFIPSYTDYYLGTTNTYFYNTSTSSDDQQLLQVIEMKNVEPIKNLLAFGIYGTTYTNSVGHIYANVFLFVAIAIFIVTKVL